MFYSDDGGQLLVALFLTVDAVNAFAFVFCSIAMCHEAAFARWFVTTKLLPSVWRRCILWTRSPDRYEVWLARILLVEWIKLQPFGSALFSLLKRAFFSFSPTAETLLAWSLDALCSFPSRRKCVSALRFCSSSSLSSPPLLLLLLWSSYYFSVFCLLFWTRWRLNFFLSGPDTKVKTDLKERSTWQLMMLLLLCLPLLRILPTRRPKRRWWSLHLHISHPLFLSCFFLSRFQGLPTTGKLQIDAEGKEWWRD